MSEMEFIARHAYRAQNSDELSFKRKDRLQLLSRLADKGWWKMALISDGTIGLCPSNYLKSAAEGASSASVSAQPDVAIEEKPAEDPFDIGPTSWSVIDDEKEAEKTQEKDKAADPFDLTSWAAEMESLLLEPSKQEPKQDIELKEKSTTDEKTDPVNVAAVVETPKSESLSSEQPATLEESNDEWVAWMERALQAEKHLQELIRAAEDDKSRMSDKLAVSEERALKFEAQVEAMMDQVKQERQEIESQHRRELSEMEGKLRKSNAAVNTDVAEFEKQIRILKLDKEELQKSVETDISQMTDLLEQEQSKHCEAVQKATQFHELYENARELVQQLEESLEEKTSELDAVRAEADRNLATEKQHRIELQKKLDVVKSETTPTPRAVDELENEIIKMRHQNQMQKQELDFCKQQVARLEGKKTSQRQSIRLGVESMPDAGAPPTMARTPELKLQTQSSSASPRTIPKADETLRAELARQRMLREQEKAQPQRDSKVMGVIQNVRSSMDLSQKQSTDNNDSTTAGASVTRSRAQEILLRARALAAKTKVDTTTTSKE